MKCMFFINGKEQDMLPADDRAIQFGDGCFTTARIINGNISFIEAHLKRLQKACTVLLIPFTDWDMLRTEMKYLAQDNADGVLKALISRGRSNRGYSIANCVNPTRLLSISAYPSHYTHWKQEGITLTLSPVRLGCNPAIAGLKHLNRLEQILIYIHLEQTNADEALVLDSKGRIIECCTANLFWRCGKKVFTPMLDQAGVNGVMRQFCLQQLECSNFHVTEVRAGIEELYDAEEVIICNALLPIVSVRAYGSQRWSIGELYHFLAPLCE